VICHLQFLFILAPYKSPFTEYQASRVSEFVWLCWRRERFPAGMETGCRDSPRTFHYFPQFSASMRTVQTRPFFYIHYHPKTHPIILEPKKIPILQDSRERRNKCQNPKIASHNNCTIQVLLISPRTIKHFFFLFIYNIIITIK